jgi:hypothetical protein
MKDSLIVEHRNTILEKLDSGEIFFLEKGSINELAWLDPVIQDGVPISPHYFVLRTCGIL